MVAFYQTNSQARQPRSCLSYSKTMTSSTSATLLMWSVVTILPSLPHVSKTQSVTNRSALYGSRQAICDICLPCLCLDFLLLWWRDSLGRVIYRITCIDYSSLPCYVPMTVHIVVSLQLSADHNDVLCVPYQVYTILHSFIACVKCVSIVACTMSETIICC